ncbi:axonemal dynein light chain domain-containing protein 1 isoform X2 [Mauremys mutica]|uniref:axonemal dynein light chain domain-containing protein 1 isoform X2 n=1 Tax=Mauremys mutica TaxID=74926 RepID=UPI001D15F6A4|nr:axonemal dynein light chain domain-containing protein 1 isoform X2 [Mauremys mutica]
MNSKPLTISFNQMPVPGPPSASKPEGRKMKGSLSLVPVSSRNPELPQLRNKSTMLDRSGPLPTSLQCDFIPKEILLALTSAASSAYSPEYLRPPKKNKSAKDFKGSMRVPDGLWQHPIRRNKFKYLIDHPICLTGAGRDVSFLCDIAGKEDGRKMSPASPLAEPHRYDSSTTSATSVADSLVPEEFHIVKNKGVLGLEYYDDKYTTLLEDSENRLRLFPSMKPSGRLEVIQLMKVMDTMLEKAGVDDEQIGITGPSQLHNVLEVLKTEQNIYNIVFHELIRQVSVDCAERGELLSKLRQRYVNLLDRIPQRMRNLYEEMMAQRVMDRHITEELYNFKESVGQLTSELCEVREHDFRVTREAERAHEELADAVRDAELNANLVGEYRELYELQRARLETQLLQLTQEKEIWSSATYDLAMKVIERNQLTLSRKLYVSEKAWTKVIKHFIVLLASQDTADLSDLQEMTEQFRELLNRIGVEVEHAENSSREKLRMVQNGLTKWMQYFQDNVFPVDTSQAAERGGNQQAEILHEEVELEEDMVLPTGSPSGAGSQELFSTSEMLNREKEADETLAQTLKNTPHILVDWLWQIRKKHRCRKEDMFWEVLQHNERQTREWKGCWEAERQDRKENAAFASRKTSFSNTKGEVLEEILQDFKNLEKMLNEDLEQYGGEVLLMKKETLKTAANLQKRWTELGQTVLSRHKDINGVLPPELRAMEEINERANELCQQYSVRINGENGVTRILTGLVSSMEDWTFKMLTNKRGSGMHESDWLKLFRVIPDWLTQVAALMTVIGSGQSHEDRSNRKPHVSVVSGDVFKMIQQWILTTTSGAEKDNIQLTQEMIDLHKALTMWIVNLLTLMVPDHSSNKGLLENESEAAKDQELKRLRGYKLEEEAMNLVPKLSRFSSYVMSCCKELVDVTVRKKQAELDSDYNYELRELEKIKTECLDWINTCNLLLSEFKGSPVSLLSLEEQRNLFGPQETQPQMHSIVVDSLPEEISETSSELGKDKTEDVDVDKKSEKGKEVLGEKLKPPAPDVSSDASTVSSEVTEDTIRYLGHDSNIHLKSLKSTAVSVSGREMTASKSTTPYSQKEFETLASLERLQEQLLEAEIRAQNAEERSESLDEHLEEALGRIQDLEKQLEKALKAQEVAPKPEVPSQEESKTTSHKPSAAARSKKASRPKH